MSPDAPEHVAMLATTPTLPGKKSPPTTVAPTSETPPPAEVTAEPKTLARAKSASRSKLSVDPAAADAPSRAQPSLPRGSSAPGEAGVETTVDRSFESLIADMDPKDAAEMRRMKILHDAKRAAEQHARENPPALSLAITSFAALDVKSDSWISPPFAAAGNMINIVGEPGTGKSKVGIDATARVTTGSQLGDLGPTVKGDVLMLISEDDPHTIVAPRLLQQGADLSRVHFHRLGTEASCLQTFDLLTDRLMLSEKLESLPDVRLVVIDSLDLFIGVKDPNRVRVGISRLLQQFEARGIALIAITPLRRTENKSPSDILAELPFSSLSAGVWHVQPDYRHPNRRRVVALKQKVADACDMEFELDESGKLIWLPTREDRSTMKRGSKLQRAARCITAQLETGPKSSSYMTEYLTACGFSESTIDRAKLKLDINTERAGKGWQWSLAE
jgi:hypothetical protein